ncbi:hypothetical protein ElyMa_000780500 [Elysia marginata]|uniref:FLYWCH-type domain-containing protein n=1 Tax=Elysia marginata TaxID=1093978 RepID=A0AAV4GVF5_9GAST|nr:hypothetical protein ElyMa_000780500 [Elysia marginata]
MNNNNTCLMKTWRVVNSDGDQWWCCLHLTGAGGESKSKHQHDAARSRGNPEAAIKTAAALVTPTTTAGYYWYPLESRRPRRQQYF